MKVVQIDTSKGWVGIIIGEEWILKILNRKFRRKFGKPVHMRDLRLSKKFSALRIFNKLFSRRGVKLYSIKPNTNDWWLKLVRRIIKGKIDALYVDFEVREELTKRVPSLYLKLLNIYVSKEDVQCADILAYGDSHRKLVKNIWKNTSIERGEP